jgi:hypothetical protein
MRQLPDRYGLLKRHPLRIEHLDPVVAGIGDVNPVAPRIEQNVLKTFICGGC